MQRFGFALVCFATLIPLAYAQGCTSAMDDCSNTSTCAAGGGAAKAGSSGSANGGKASNSAAGSSSGGEGGGSTAGSSGSSAMTGGAGPNGAGEGGGGGSATLPCDGACTAPKPICDEPNDTCVECLEEADCATGAKKKCDTTANACVACLESTDCPSATAAKCDGGACMKCTSSDDCAHIAGKTVCDTAAGECVECTGKDYASCGMDAGSSLVCDSKTRTCTTNKEHAADLCRACVSDAHCPAGQLCVKETFGVPAAEVGHFCFWKKGDTGNGAPATCLPAADPYAKTLSNQTSIDGTKADICGLGSSTCVARNQLADAKDCSTANAADNSKCGFAPGKDSKCVQADVGVFRCTMACASIDDCPGNLVCDGTSFCKL